MKFLKRARLFIIALLLANMWVIEAFAHGGGGGPKPAPSKPVVIDRKAPQKPSVLDDMQLQQVVALKVTPKDVLILKCTLAEYSPCRGLTILLLDTKGEKVLESSSGHEGLVGFSGLSSNSKYTAKISSSKYSGDAVVEAGDSWILNGDRVSEELNR